MVFENVTALELHLHTNDALEPDQESVPRERPVVKTETPLEKMKSKGLVVGMVVVSVALSIVVTLLARKFASSNDDDAPEN